MEDTNHIGWDLYPLALFYDDGLDVGRENLRAVANAIDYVAVDETGRPTRGVDGTATDGKGWRRYDFNTDCLVISKAAPDIFEQQAPHWIKQLRVMINKDRLGALNEFIELLAFQARYTEGKKP